MPADEILQTVTLEDGTEVEIHALTPAEASRVKPNFFTWDEVTARKVAAIAIVKPSGILDQPEFQRRKATGGQRHDRESGRSVRGSSPWLAVEVG